MWATFASVAADNELTINSKLLLELVRGTNQAEAASLAFHATVTRLKIWNNDIFSFNILLLLLRARILAYFNTIFYSSFR